jgi:hypothetical protein
LALLAGVATRPAAQQEAIAPPDEVARAVLRADSAGDWATVLGLAHPDALARFRARQVFQLRMLGAHGWPAVEAGSDSSAEARWQEVRGRQERFLLDSVFQVPDADSLARTSPDTVYARWVRGLLARSASDTTAPVPRTPGYRVVGAVRASDTLAYAVMERPLEQPLGPLPQMFRDLPKETHMAVVMVLRRHGREWRSMLDGVGESRMLGPELLPGE